MGRVKLQRSTSKVHFWCPSETQYKNPNGWYVVYGLCILSACLQFCVAIILAVRNESPELGDAIQEQILELVSKQQNGANRKKQLATASAPGSKV